MINLSMVSRAVGPGPDDDVLAARLRALSEPNRLQIVTLLRASERCVCEIESALGLSQSLVSNHLRVLRQAGLVIARRHEGDARWIYYRLDREAVDGLRVRLSWLLDLSAFDPSPISCTPEGRPVRS